MSFGAPTYFHLLWLLPLLILFYAWAFRRKRRALTLFGNPELMGKMTATTSRTRQVWKTILGILGVLFLVLAAVRPQFGTKLEIARRSGVDIIVVLDTSLSMLTEDIKPNRLERAKQEIRSFIDKLAGDRIGLVAFSGVSFVQCPLTLDYSAAKIFLGVIDTDLIPVPGTAIGAAIRTATKAFNVRERKYKVVVLLTDGEDHTTDPVEAAKKAADEGVRIYTIGLGTRAGELIPVRDARGGVDYKRDRQGTPVKSRLDEATLEKIALATGGKYYRSTVGEMELDRIYEEISTMEKRELRSKKFTRYEERFQYPLFLAIVAFALEALLSDRRRVRREWQGRFM